MIGTRSAATAAAVGVVVIAAIGPGATRPEVVAGADALVRERTADADAALDALELELAAALDEGRRGAARVVAGDAEPGPPLREASRLVTEAMPEAVTARTTRDALESALRARQPAAEPLPSAPDPAALASIAGQLAASADAGDEFAMMRARAEAVTASLEDALVALESGDPDTAADHVAAAREDHDAIAAWEVGVVTLPVWVDTTDAMIAAVDDLVTATQLGDARAVESAAEAVAALGPDAVSADRALLIAIAEGGNAVTAAPLSRLASELRQLETLRGAIAAEEMP